MGPPVPVRIVELIVVILRFTETIDNIAKVIEKRWNRSRVWIIVISHAGVSAN